MMPAPGQTLKPLVKLGRRPDDCWQWLGPKTEAGHGKKTFNGRDVLAHRWIWGQLFGPIPDGLVISATCGTAGCVNPHHLRACTQADACRGSANTTLTPEDVREIKRLLAESDGPAVRQHLADRYGISRTTLSDLKRGRSWRRAKPFHGPSQPRNQFTRGVTNV